MATSNEPTPPSEGGFCHVSDASRCFILVLVFLASSCLAFFCATHFPLFHVRFERN